MKINRIILSSTSIVALLSHEVIPVTIADPAMDQLASIDASRLFAKHFPRGGAISDADFDKAADGVFSAANAAATRMAETGTPFPLRQRYLWTFKEEIARQIKESYTNV